MDTIRVTFPPFRGTVANIHVFFTDRATLTVTGKESQLYKISWVLLRE